MMPLNRNRPPAPTGKAAYIGNDQHCQYTIQPAAAAIAQAHGLKPCGKDSWQGNCPACGYANAFSLSVKNGVLLWHCHACGDGEAVGKALGAYGGSLRGKCTPKAPALKKQIWFNKDKAALIHKLWAEALPAEGTVVEQYLSGRGLKGAIPPTLRFMPSCLHSPTGKSFMVMVAAITRWPSREVVAIHRTYLKPDGSGKIEHPQSRMMLGHATGGAVRLAPAGPQLVIAEGIETALSVQQAAGLPAWACLSTSGLQNVALPQDVQEAIIAADHDPPGLKAANAAAERLTQQGRRVRIAMPPRKGSDFNDIIQGAAHE